MTELDEAASAAAWERDAPVWIEQVRAGRDLYREAFNNPLFLAFLPDLVGKQVLDLGCGKGRNTRLLAQRGARLTGIDLSPTMIEAARAAEAQTPLGIDYRVGSFTGLDEIADESFDAVVSTMALMDSPGFDKTARAAFRVLRSGGDFVFSVTHPCFVTRGYRWIRDEDGQEEGLQISDYFSREPFVESWCMKFAEPPDVPKFRTPRFPYRLEDYVNALCDAGFRTRRLSEPRPTEEMVAKNPWLARLRQHFPLFLYIAASKD